MIINFIHIVRKVPAGGRRLGHTLKKEIWDMDGKGDEVGGGGHRWNRGGGKATATTTPLPSWGARRRGQ
jgi:hypothetical protein